MTSVLGKLPPPMKPAADWTDGDLVSACLRGDQLAWFTLVEKYKKLVYSVPVKYRMSPDDAADIFQSVWTELYIELKKLRAPGALRSWLVTVATHKCYHAARRAQRHENAAIETEAADERADFERARHDLEREQMLRDAIAVLPDRCREIVRLLFYQDPPLAYAELARHLGLAEGSIGFIRGRCLDRLRKSLQQMGF